jgi:hypothetical protein
MFATMAARWISGYDRSKDKYLLNAALMAGIVVAIVHYFPSRAYLEKRVADQFPVHALEYIRQHPLPGPLFNSYGFGGYMILSGYKTFIDGRGELFEEVGVFGDYMHITLLEPGAMKVLEGYGIRSCLLERDEPLATVLSFMPDWQKVYSDNVSALYVKRDAAAAPKQATGAILPVAAQAR